MKSLFMFTSDQRKGIFAFLLLIVILQLAFFFMDFSIPTNKDPEEQKWLSLQSEVDSLKNASKNKSENVFLFNPNFITDYKGYKLGMSVVEIDRLLEFRKTNKFINSAEEFQKVTKVSDSLLNVISPLFKFPDWINNRRVKKEYENFPIKAFAKKEKIIPIDINQATKKDLIKIYGIGEAISLRILKQKDVLGGFVSMEQMSDVWGLSPEVIIELNNHFKISVLPKLKKIDINNASLKELSQFYYFKYAIAKEIVTYRSMNGDFKNIEDLTKIKGFPVDKAKTIALYLDFN